MQHALLARSALITYGLDISGMTGTTTDIANEQPSIFVANWGTELDDQVTVGPATLRVGVTGGDPIAIEGSVDEVGGESAAMLPPNCALLVRKSTGLGGRRGRGRCYIPWVVQEAAANDVGVIDGASLTVRQGDADAWLADLAAGSSGTSPTPMYLLHDTSGAGAEPAPTEVTGLSVDALIATQRRRLGR
jgi:hypothetical protein